MSIVTNTVETYHAGSSGVGYGNREALSDELTIISPADTMFYGSLKEDNTVGKAKYVEWLYKAIAAGADNANIEGNAPTSATAATSPTRVGNYMQEIVNDFLVSFQQDAVNAVDMNEAELTSQNLEKHAKDIEYAALQAVQASGSSGVAAKMKGALNFVTTNIDKASDATLAAAGTVSGGTARDLTSDLVKNTMQNAFSSGGNPSVLYGNAFQMKRVSSFATEGANRRIVNNGKVEDFVDIYTTPFGTLKVTPHRGMPTSQILCSDPKYWSKKTLISTYKRPLPTTATGNWYQILTCWTLICKAEAAHGRVTDLTTA